MSLREIKGRDIADKYRIVKNGNLYVVPSASGNGKYTVDAEAKRCSCPDFDFRQEPCKHIYAVEISVRRERKTTVKTAPNGQTTTTTTETVTVKRKTYAQPSWPAYHSSQVNEKRIFLYLLHQLCQGVGSPAQYGVGRKRLPLEDMIFAMAYKVYSTLSTRRFMTDLKDAHAKGYLSALPCYNSVINYFESEMLTPYLQMLIEESSLPLSAIETDFAVDSSGLTTSRFIQWMHAKYSDPHLIERREWIKVSLARKVQKLHDISGKRDFCPKSLRSEANK